MTTNPITIAYTPAYLDWQLGEGHPTKPERARLAVEQVMGWATSADVDVRTLVPILDWDRLETVYKRDLASGPGPKGHLARVRNGESGEWSGVNERLGEVAALMFLGTVDLVDQIEADGFEPRVYFNPQGAKHHALVDRSSGFCVFNDMAWAARHFMLQGKRVAYLDWDAHHGDGVEKICELDRDIATVSIHDGTIFPGTGQASNGWRSIMNFPLESGAGDQELKAALVRSFDELDVFQPDVVLVACGADGLAGDPLSTLNYTLDGIRYVAERVGQFAAAMHAPVVIGGAGGYQPLTETPAAWAATVQAVHEGMRPPSPEEQAARAAELGLDKYLDGGTAA